MASFHRFLAVLVAVTLPLAVHAQESDKAATMFDGWDSFLEKREAHPLMRKMGPYLAAEWWQEIEKQPLWAGRTVRYDTGISVDADGLVGLTIVVDDEGAWKEVAHLLGPKGRASMPIEATARAGPVPPRTRPPSDRELDTIGAPTMAVRPRYDGYENTVVPVDLDPAPIRLRSSGTRC